MNQERDNIIAATSVEPGYTLAQAREQAGMSVEQISTKLHLSPSRVEALENNNFRDLPEAAYVRGYIRNYAHLLGLEEGPLIAAFNERVGHNKLVRTPAAGTTRQDQIKSDNMIKYVGVGIAATLLLSFVAWWQNTKNSDSAAVVTEGQKQVVEQTQIEPETTVVQGQPGVAEGQGGLVIGESAPEGAVSSEPVGTQSDPVVPPAAQIQAPKKQETSGEKSPVTEIETAPAGKKSGDDIATSGEAAKAATVPPASVPLINGQAPTAAVATSQIVLYVQTDSWADIRDAKDNKLIYETVPGGRVVTLQGQPPFNVFLGNADGVKLFMDGAEYNISQHKRGLVARFTLDKAGR